MEVLCEGAVWRCCVKVLCGGAVCVNILYKEGRGSQVTAISPATHAVWLEGAGQHDLISPHVLSVHLQTC